MIGTYRACPIPIGRITPSIGVMLARRAKRWPDHPLIFIRQKSGDYQPILWKKAWEDIASIAHFLSEKGVDRGDRVLVFSPNSYEMLLWELAVCSMGAISVPIFYGYSFEGMDYIFTHAEPKVAFVNGKERVKMAKASSQASKLAALVTHENFHEILKKGSTAFLEKQIQKVKPHHPCFIQYTSGTTGDPKGVMLTHRNIMSQQAALSKLWNLHRSCRFLSYLPWHHSFGGLFERFSALYNGAPIYLEDSFGKDLDRLLENWTLVRPTQFFSVPKIYIALVNECRLNPELKKVLLHEDLQFIFTAAAPLPKEIGEYFKAHNIPVMEGWGLTETSPCVTLTPLGKERVHSFVGEPIPGCEILTTEDSQILVRGPNVMKGYFRDPEKTQRVIDHYGWFNTGDLGEITDYGLRMICRVDGLFKLANGEKVSSMMVENALTISARWVLHAVAVGSGENFVGALILPNFRNIQAWGQKKKKKFASLDEMVRDKEVQKLILEEVEKAMTDFQPKYMAVKGIALIPEELSLEKGELTPTMKVVRHRVARRYQDWIEALYKPHKHKDKQPYILRLGKEAYAFTW